VLQEIPCTDAFLRGHGTFVQDGKLLASVAGVVQRVNKLVSVIPMRSRYTGNVGDVVIARVMEVGNKRWTVDVGAGKAGILMLSSINLPSGEQESYCAAPSPPRPIPAMSDEYAT
jgi:exosome complex component RRP4